MPLFKFETSFDHWHELLYGTLTYGGPTGLITINFNTPAIVGSTSVTTHTNTGRHRSAEEVGLLPKV